MNIRRLLHTAYNNADGKQLFFLALVVLFLVNRYFWVGLAGVLLWYGYKLFKSSDLDVKSYCQNNNSTICKKYIANLNENDKIAETIRKDYLDLGNSYGDISNKETSAE